MTLAEEILTFNDAKIEKVSVPEWGPAGEKIYVRLMTGAQRDVWEAAIYVRKQLGETAIYDNMTARLAVLCACDEKGVPIFQPDQSDDLGGKSSTAVKRIGDAAAKLNKLTKQDFEELTKN